MRLLGQFSTFFFFFYDKISQVQKSIKTQVQFFIKCRLKVDLVLYTYVFIYLMATVKKFTMIINWILIN